MTVTIFETNVLITHIQEAWKGLKADSYFCVDATLLWALILLRWCVYVAPHRWLKLNSSYFYWNHCNPEKREDVKRDDVYAKWVEAEGGWIFHGWGKAFAMDQSQLFQSASLWHVVTFLGRCTSGCGEGNAATPYQWPSLYSIQNHKSAFTVWNVTANFTFWHLHSH